MCNESEVLLAVPTSVALHGFTATWVLNIHSALCIVYDITVTQGQLTMAESTRLKFKTIICCKLLFLLCI